ncbi:hypothetical protein [Streptomyces sp. KMM 9044]|uniref:hypothetical protein n=1 Tax=Streptomyces sp. KMM 9044 TaxID=2744474 RepID=UPI0022B2311C|nr:hypothetical protein [Streptomyces sp. KMM 9044]WAX76636.1 hypothetical protein HUV60_002015 [Streptomyces sp. KMM 9044]
MVALCVPVAALSPLVACSRGDPPNEPAERFGMADIDYERAIRLSVAEVPAGELVARELKEPESKSAVWESRIANQDGRLTTVRLGATRGEVLGTSPGPDLADFERQEDSAAQFGERSRAVLSGLGRARPACICDAL